MKDKLIAVLICAVLIVPLALAIVYGNCGENGRYQMQLNASDESSIVVLDTKNGDVYLSIIGAHLAEGFIRFPLREIISRKYTKEELDKSYDEHKKRDEEIREMLKSHEERKKNIVTPLPLSKP